MLRKQQAGKPIVKAKWYKKVVKSLPGSQRIVLFLLILLVLNKITYYLLHYYEMLPFLIVEHLFYFVIYLIYFNGIFKDCHLIARLFLWKIYIAMQKIFFAFA